MAEDVSITWEGLDTLTTMLKELPSNANHFLANEMYDTVTEAFNESQRQVPVRTGFLKGSGTVSIDNSGDNILMIIGYGGSAAGYALAVHENLAAHHKPPTKAKYLEDPVNVAASQMDGRMSAHVDAVVLGQVPLQSMSELTGEGGGNVPVVTGRRSAKTIADRIRASRAKGPHPMSEEEIHEAIGMIDRARRNRRNR